MPCSAVMQTATSSATGPMDVHALRAHEKAASCKESRRAWLSGRVCASVSGGTEYGAARTRERAGTALSGAPPTSHTLLQRRDVTREPFAGWLTCLMLPQMARFVESRKARLRELQEEFEARQQALTEARSSSSSSSRHLLLSAMSRSTRRSTWIISPEKIHIFAKRLHATTPTCGASHGTSWLLSAELFGR